jgi:hypothetical protein
MTNLHYFQHIFVLNFDSYFLKYLLNVTVIKKKGLRKLETAKNPLKILNPQNHQKKQSFFAKCSKKRIFLFFEIFNKTKKLFGKSPKNISFSKLFQNLRRNEYVAFRVL